MAPRSKKTAAPVLDLNGRIDALVASDHRDDSFAVSRLPLPPPHVDLRIGTSTKQKSYRSFRQAWSGQPTTSPALAAVRDRSSGRATVYVSWNGATEVTHWRVHAGPRRSDLRAVGTAPRRGFETAINLGTNEGYVAVSALDRHGRALGHSAVIPV